MIGAIRAGERLDALPIGPFHRRVMLLVGLGILSDAFDNTLSAAVLATMLAEGFSTLRLNSVFLSATFAGLAVGAALAGWLSDRYGRAFAFQFNLLLFGILALCSSLAPSMYWLIAMRAVMAIGMGAEYVMCYGLIIEFMPPHRRGRYLGILGVFGGIGVSLTSLFGVLVIPVLGWRSMYVIGGLGTLWVWWLRRSLPESPRWLESMGRLAEAETVLSRIEREAGAGARSADTPLTSHAMAVTGTEQKQWVPITILFSRPVIRRTMLAIFLNITCLFGSYTITGWIPTFFVSQGMSVTRSLAFNAAIMAGYVAGPLLCVFIADRLGRPWGLVMFGIFCAILGTIYPLLSTPWQIILCGFVLVAMVAAFLTMGLGTTPELFPTEYRFRGGGLAQMAGRVFLILSPFVVLELLTNYGVGGVTGAVSGMYIVVTLLMIFVGIDTNRSLEAIEPRASA